MKEIQEILILEIRRIYERCKVEELEASDLRRLESLTKSWRTYFGTEIDEAKSDLEGMSVSELRGIIKSEEDQLQKDSGSEA